MVQRKRGWEAQRSPNQRMHGRSVPTEAGPNETKPRHFLGLAAPLPSSSGACLGMAGARVRVPVRGVSQQSNAKCQLGANPEPDQISTMLYPPADQSTGPGIVAS
ncbi:hypothetical protein KIL84_001568 [Mauremys mutica]|uniref:Uncharacterized protein n=1 Tax=Mauremys mutica TaxID=74926 RepID=A0A9D3XHG2_9SAUR|nr:hypothetical protein KIL84_001568 [Mauremys mutica]